MDARDPHIAIEVQPLVATKQKNYKTTELTPVQEYEPRFVSTSRAITEALKKLNKFERKEVAKAAGLFIGLGAGLGGLYYGFVYLSIRFFGQPEPTLLKYLNTAVNGTTCKEVFPILGNVCTYKHVKDIPHKAPLAFYCASILDKLTWRGVDVINAFFNNDCFAYFPKLDFGNVHDITYGLVLDCLKFASNYYLYDYTYQQYLETTIGVMGDLVLCNTIYPFANETVYNSFRDSAMDLCVAIIDDIGYEVSDLYNAYGNIIKNVGSCNATYPVPLHITDGMNYIYGTDPNIETCFATTDTLCWKRWGWDDNWTSPGRVGFIILGIGIAIALIAATTYLIYKGCQRLCKSYEFGDLPQDKQQEINSVLNQYEQNATIAGNVSLTSARQKILSVESKNYDDIEKVRSFLDAPENTPLHNFFQKDASHLVTDQILTKTNLMK